MGDVSILENSNQVHGVIGWKRLTVPHRRKVESSGPPGPGRRHRIGTIGEMLVEDNALGGQAVQRRRRQPVVAITAKITEVQAPDREDKDFHTVRFYGCEPRATSQADSFPPLARYNEGMSNVPIRDLTWERMIRAVEKVKERLDRAATALVKAGIPYAVVGGNAVAAWVSQVDEAAVRNTQDVDLLLRRSDLDAATSALAQSGFVRRHVAGIDLFLDGPKAKARDAVHVVFAGEKVRPEYVLPAPDVTESQALATFQVLNLDALVRMKLTSFRDKDRTHVRDLIDVGLVDASWCARLAPDLAQRLQQLLDTPHG